MTQQLIVVKRIIILKRVVLIFLSLLRRFLGTLRRLRRLLWSRHTGSRDFIIRRVERIALVGRLYVDSPSRSYRSLRWLLHLCGLLLRSFLHSLFYTCVVVLAALLESRVSAHNEEVEQTDDHADGSHDDVQNTHVIWGRSILVLLVASKYHGHSTRYKRQERMVQEKEHRSTHEGINEAKVFLNIGLVLSQTSLKEDKQKREAAKTQKSGEAFTRNRQTWKSLQNRCKDFQWLCQLDRSR